MTIAKRCACVDLGGVLPAWTSLDRTFLDATLSGIVSEAERIAGDNMRLSSQCKPCHALKKIWLSAMCNLFGTRDHDVLQLELHSLGGVKNERLCRPRRSMLRGAGRVRSAAREAAGQVSWLPPPICVTGFETAVVEFVAALGCDW